MSPKTGKTRKKARFQAFPAQKNAQNHDKNQIARARLHLFDAFFIRPRPSSARDFVLSGPLSPIAPALIQGRMLRPHVGRLPLGIMRASAASEDVRGKEAFDVARKGAQMKRGALRGQEVPGPFTGSAPGVHEACMRSARRANAARAAVRDGTEGVGERRTRMQKRRAAKQHGSETPAGEAREGNQVRSADKLKGLIGTPFQFQSAP